MDRQERAKIAQEHNKKILEKYPSQISQLLGYK